MPAPSLQTTNAVHIERVTGVLQSGGYKNFLAFADSGNHRWYLDSWMYLAVISLPTQTDTHQGYHTHTQHTHPHTPPHPQTPPPHPPTHGYRNVCVSTCTCSTEYSNDLSSVLIGQPCCNSRLLTLEPSSVEHLVGLHSCPYRIQF